MEHKVIFIIIIVIIIIFILFVFLIVYFVKNKSKNISKSGNIPKKDEIRKTDDTMKEISNYCKVQKDCPGGYICDGNGKCKKGIGEICTKTDQYDESGDCHHMYICEGVCRTRKSEERRRIIKNVKLEKENIQINSESSEVSKDDKFEKREISENQYYQKYQEKEQNIQKNDKVYEQKNSNNRYEETKMKEFVIDVCCYSIYIIYLMNNGSIIREDTELKRSSRVSSNQKIISICSFNGYITGISGGSLFYLNNDTLEKENWEWKKINLEQKNIERFSYTHDGENLWIENDKIGILYDREFRQIEKVFPKERRTYGVNLQNYLTVRNSEVISYPNKRSHGKYEGIIDMIIDYQGIVHFLRKKKYRMIKIINYEICYIC